MDLHMNLTNTIYAYCILFPGRSKIGSARCIIPGILS